MEYRCRRCGAYLDPGEKCDCEEKENGLPDANQTSPMRSCKPHAVTIPYFRGKVKPNPLRDLRVANQLPAKDMVETVRELYPKYDRTLQTKCEHGDLYGIDIKLKALYALLEKYAPEELAKEKHRRDGGHKYKRKVMCRLPEDDFIALHEWIRKDGFDTMQSWLTFVIRTYLNSKPAKSK